MRKAGRLWLNYKYFVEGALQGEGDLKEQDIIYWRQKLFTSFVTYLIPVCLIALIPGVVMSLKLGYLVIAVADVLTPLSIAVIVFNKKISFYFKKRFVVFVLYCLAIVLIVYLGSFGPGMLYLLALSIFTTISFSRVYAYYSVILNLLICVGCAFIIQLKLFGSPLIYQFSLDVWIAVTSNLIFLSWVMVVLISNTINSLEDTINKELLLRGQLQQQVTEKMQINKLLKESEHHYRSLFSLSPSPMWVLDSKNFRFLQVNDAAVKNYGYTYDEFMAMSINDIKMAADMEGFAAYLEKNFEARVPFNLVVQHRRKNNEQFYVDIRFNSIPFKGKRATLVIARDITEQINHTQAIETQNEKLRSIAYIQSHFVRAPLARILGLVDLITRNANEHPDPQLLVYLDTSAKELDDIIREITDTTVMAKRNTNVT